jgi:hypothetical protein
LWLDASTLLLKKYGLSTLAHVEGFFVFIEQISEISFTPMHNVDGHWSVDVNSYQQMKRKISIGIFGWDYLSC